jgi:hypothetical protein
MRSETRAAIGYDDDTAEHDGCHRLCGHGNRELSVFLRLEALRFRAG